MIWSKLVYVDCSPRPGKGGGGVDEERGGKCCSEETGSHWQSLVLSVVGTIGIKHLLACVWLIFRLDVQALKFRVHASGATVYEGQSLAGACEIGH